MTTQPFDHKSGRATRGGTVARVLLVILGAVLALFGLILAIATISICLDGDASILFLLPFTIASVIGGIFIIVSQLRGDGSAKADAKSTIPAGVGVNDPHVVSSVPLSGPAPAPTAKPSPTPSSTGGSSADDIAHLIHRSSDVMATTRDLVRHELAPGASAEKRHLASMLNAAGVMNWSDAPACGGGKLSRTEHFWFRMNTDDLTDEQYDILISAEAALSVNQDLPGVKSFSVESAEAEQACLELMRSMCDQVIERGELTKEGLRVCYRDENAANTPDEWVVRSSVCNAAECLRTPFRVVYQVRSNVADGFVLLDIEAPRPRCMAIFTPDIKRQSALARAYAFRLATTLASHAFASSDKVTRVVANCHEHNSTDTLVSLDIDRSILKTMSDVARGTAIESGFPTDNRIRASFEGGWFAPVEPFVELDSPHAMPATARTYPELDDRPATDAIMRTCHAKRISDLGINENAARLSAWDSIRPQLGTSTKQAVSTLVAARDNASDITVAEACNRTMQALVDGKADLEDLKSLASLFIDGSTLDRAMARASQLLDDGNGHEDPEAALQVLQTALAPIDDMGVYLDDETYVYRYFGSVSERIHHNAVIDEGGRQIKLVPDAYYNAHSYASTALGMLGRNEEALAHAEVCLRLAPTSTHATMRKVRILEAQSRVYEAADLIINALNHAVTPRDAAICHYRLAYMQWKLGREDLAAACYVRSMNWDTEMSDQAREELDDLLSSQANLERPSEEQADALLAREGIPLGCVRTDGERTLASAVACMDAGVLYSARPLLAVLFGMNGDDVVMGVYRSLSVAS